MIKFMNSLHKNGLVTMNYKSNWQLYVEEFGVALFQLDVPAQVQCIGAEAPPMTRFEHKYRESGQDLWCLRAKFYDSSPRLHLENRDSALRE